MIENTINAILTYGMEAFRLTETDYKTLNRIQIKAIRVILNLPENIANAIILAETGVDQIDLIIKKTE